MLDVAIGSFPNPVNETSARLVAAGVVAQGAAFLLLQEGWVLVPLLYGFVAPGLLAFLAFSQAWFADARPWLDAKYSQDTLLRGELAGDGWSHLAVTSLVWLVVPMVVAVVNVLRSEVK